MRKFLGLILWFGCFFAAIVSLFTGIDSNDNLTCLLFVVFALISGIGRRVFHIKRELVAQIGTKNAILSRINCRRFYFSIPKYVAIGFAFYYLMSGEESDYLKMAISYIVWVAAHVISGRTCPHCGFKMIDDGETLGDTHKNDLLTIFTNKVEIFQAKTNRWHCPRCGKRIKKNTSEKIGEYGV